MVNAALEKSCPGDLPCCLCPTGPHATEFFRRGSRRSVGCKRAGEPPSCRYASANSIGSGSIRSASGSCEGARTQAHCRAVQVLCCRFGKCCRANFHDTDVLSFNHLRVDRSPGVQGSEPTDRRLFWLGSDRRFYLYSICVCIMVFYITTVN